MQKNRNQGDLLRNPQHHLQKIRRPTGKKPSSAAHRHALRIADKAAAGGLAESDGYP
jgi:hypothetical protein